MNENTETNPTTAATGAASNVRASGSGDKRWTDAHALMISGESILVQVGEVANNKEGRPCGLNTKLFGLRAFLPGSQLPRGTRCEDLKGQSIQVKVLECDRNDRGGKLVVSHLAHVNQEKAQFIGSLSVGMEINGKVVNFVEKLGYFVNIGGADALLHLTQTPTEEGAPKCFNVGDDIVARVSSVDVEKGKVNLTMRAPRPDRRESENAPPVDRSPRAPRSWTTRTSPVAAPKVVPTPAKSTRRPTKSAPSKRSSGTTQTFSSFKELLDSISDRTNVADETSLRS